MPTLGVVRVTNRLDFAADLQAQQQQLRDSLRQEFETKLDEELASKEAERQELASKLAQVRDCVGLVAANCQYRNCPVRRKKTWRALMKAK